MSHMPLEVPTAEPTAGTKKAVAVSVGLVAAAALGALAMVVGDGSGNFASASAISQPSPTTIPYFKNYEELKKVSPPTGEGENYRPAGWRDSSNDATELFDAAAIEADLQARLGERYGGMWQNGSRFNVAVIRPTAADWRLVADYGDIVPASFSFDQLQKWQEVATQVMSDARVASGISVDLEANKVLIASNEAERLRPALEANIPRAALKLISRFHASNSSAVAKP